MAKKLNTPGIYTRTSKDGTVTYAVRYYVPDGDGWKQQQKTFDKYQAAVDFKVTRRAEIKNGDYIPPSELTVKELAESFLESKQKQVRPQTYNGYKIKVDKYIAAQLGHYKVTNLKAVDVENAAAEWSKATCHKTANAILCLLNALFKFGCRKLELKKNPMAHVERLRKSSAGAGSEPLEGIPDIGENEPEAKAGVSRAVRPDEVYSVLELKQIIDAAESGYEKAYLMTAILTGMRPGELNALRWQVVDLKKGTLFVNRSLTQLPGGPVLDQPKTKSAYRLLKLAPELISELRHWKLACPVNPNGIVFVNEFGRPNKRKTNNRMLKRVCKRAGVRALSINNLRHSFASQHLISGTQLLEVSKMMGHATPAITLNVYSRWAEKEKSQAEIVLAGRIFAAQEQPETVRTGSAE